MPQDNNIDSVMSTDELLEMFNGCIIGNMNSLDQSWDNEVKFLKENHIWDAKDMTHYYKAIRLKESTVNEFPEDVVRLIRWINENALSQVYMEVFKRMNHGNKQQKS